MEYGRRNYAIEKSDLDPIIAKVKSGEIKMELDEEILIYLKAIIFIQQSKGNIDDWECILDDNMFDVKVTHNMNKIQVNKLLGELKM